MYRKWDDCDLLGPLGSLILKSSVIFRKFNIGNNSIFVCIRFSILASGLRIGMVHAGIYDIESCQAQVMSSIPSQSDASIEVRTRPTCKNNRILFTQDRY
mmetsp:Transcript_75888/g.153971  ORF Transcript_75888/g.153971 Transcript_75888/m.153971 type:complete len:100 (+) Transcript_75888:2795-3094(+)